MKARTILIIDDDPLVWAFVHGILAPAGYDVISAFDGLSGIERARAAQPVVILLDMIMPGLDGISTCQRLKQDPVLGDIPIVGITGPPDLTYTEKAFRAGAEFFVAKPFGKETLLEAVGMALEAAEKRSPRQRLHPRFQAAVPVRCLLGDNGEATREIVGQTGNLSLGGVLTWLPETLAPGTVLRLGLELPEGSVPAEGAVIWQQSQPTDDKRSCHGIKFLRFLEDVGRVQYRRFLSQIAAGSAA